MANKIMAKEECDLGTEEKNLHIFVATWLCLHEVCGGQSKTNATGFGEFTKPEKRRLAQLAVEEVKSSHNYYDIAVFDHDVVVRSVELPKKSKNAKTDDGRRKAKWTLFGDTEDQARTILKRYEPATNGVKTTEEFMYPLATFIEKLKEETGEWSSTNSILNPKQELNV